MQKSVTAAFMSAALNQGKKSTRTRIERHRAFVRFETFAREHRFHGVTPQNLTLKQVRMFVDELRKTNTPRSLQNVLSHLRCALRGAGREHVANSPEWGNAALRVESQAGDRTGKHIAVDAGVLAAAQEKALALGDAGREFRVLSELQRAFGLRLQESVQSADSLRAWRASLAAGQPVLVSRGTKGGRSRMTVVPEALRERAMRAVDAALGLARENGGKLVQAVSLKAARDRASNVYRAAGLRAAVSSHGLRVAFAHDAYRSYREQGFDESGALARVSQDLGHGSGRGRYAKSVYLREIFSND